jgi:hypothetical protein
LNQSVKQDLKKPDLRLRDIGAPSNDHRVWFFQCRRWLIAV